eukprot:6590448-Prymnesium_polylepis.1
MTPWVITLLNTANTLGETTFPYLVGVAFDRKLHSALGALLSAAQARARARRVICARTSRHLPRQ